MTAEEFEEKHIPASAGAIEPNETFEDDGEEILMLQDIQESLSLLRKVKRMLDYISDTELCKTVTKRERAVMLQTSHDVGAYLDNVSANYEETEE